MSGSIAHSTQDNRVSSKTICSINLSMIVDAKLHGDAETMREATEIINSAYSLQQQADELTQRLTVETIASLESRWADALILKEKLDDELRTENLKSYQFQNEAGRISGRLQQARNRLSEHLLTRKKWIAALTSPSTVQQWEAKKGQLEKTIKEIETENADLQIEVNEFNADLEKIAYKLRTTIAEEQHLYAKISRMKGSNEIQHDRATGLAT